MQLVLQRRNVQVGDRPQSSEVERALDSVELLIVDVELADQQVEHPVADVGLHLEPYGGPEPPADELAFERLQQVVDVVLVDGEVLVAGHPEQRGLDDVHAREQRGDVRTDHLLDQHEPGVVDADEPRQQRRNLHPREVLPAAFTVAHHDGEVQRQTGDVGERVRRIDRERRQDREDVLLEQRVGPLTLLGRRARRRCTTSMPASLQRGQDLVAIELGVLLSEDVSASRRSGRAARARTGPPATRRPRPVATRRCRPATRTMKNSSRLSAKIAMNRARSSSGVSRVGGELEHPRVEVEPAALAVDEPLRVARAASTVRAGG